MLGTILFSGNLLPATAQHEKVNTRPMIVKQGHDRYQLQVDGRPFLVLGAQLWNSSDWPYILDKEWPQLKELHCNTLEAPVYWQNIEPEQGRFHFSELDSLIDGARKTGLKLVLLWFGSYKNGSSSYAPEWILSHPEKFTRIQNAQGEELPVLSPLSTPNLEADKAAFAALMRHVKQRDDLQHTVVLVQVENESGALGTDRDYSTKANTRFKDSVPSALVTQLTLKPGTWQEVFGRQAAEAFSAYHTAVFVNAVAEAGKQVYDLPMYTNVWLREDRFRRPGDYPSGGAVATMIPVWKAAAPAIAFLSPDIYLANHTVFTDICREYARPDNPFFIPELGKGMDFAREQFYALGDFKAMGVSVYGIDPFGADPSDQRDTAILDKKFKSIADNYRLLSGAIPKIAALQAKGKLRAVGEEYGLHEQLISMGDYDILCSFGYPAYRNTPMTGRALIGQLGENEFLIIGFDTRFQFRPQYGSGYAAAEYLMIEEGYYDEKGQWVRKRIWNGDEAYHSTLTPEGNILRIRLRKVKAPR